MTLESLIGGLTRDEQIVAMERKYGRHLAADALVGENGPLNGQADIADRRGDT